MSRPPEATIPRGDRHDGAPQSSVVDLVGVLDAVDLPLIVLGTDRRLVRFNPAAADTFLLAPSDVRRPIREISALADAEWLESLCSQVMVDGVPCRREFNHGGRRFLLRVAAYLGAAGHVEGAVLTFTNVTAFRASLEQAIYEREYTKAILNTVTDPLVVLDSKLRIQTANRAFYSMFAVSRDQTQGVPLREFGDAAWKASVLWELLEARLAGDGRFESLEIERAFPVVGRRSVVIDARRLCREGGSAMILLTFHDVTERKRAVEELRRSREELLDFVENANVGMHWVGPNEIVQWVNRTELEMLGYTREEFVGRHIAEFHVDKAAIRDVLRRLKGGESVCDCAAQLRCKDGSVRDVLINSNVLWDGDTFVHTRCFTRDVTEQKKAEEAIRQSQRALVEADRRKDEFLATLAHELRNPLAPIRNALQLLRKGNASSEDAARVQDTMERQLMHMVRLVDDLLELSRISRGQIELKKQRTELSTVVAHAVEASRPLIESRGHRLSISLPKEPLVVDGDSIRLSQVFANLLNNAAKYTEPGGSISITAWHENETHVVSVVDTGIGIPPDMLLRVFEMFTQVDGSRGASQEGLGIGLNLVRNLVEMHGGSVEARSAGLGHGSEFLVRLPAAELAPRSELPASPPPEKKPVPPALRILIADDNQDSADTMGELLSSLGADVKVTYDGSSALEALPIHRPSVMVLDLGMPGLDGHEVARRVRMDPEFRHLTLIALTGWGLEENRRRTKEAGFDHHLVKPVEFRKLEALLASLSPAAPAADATEIRPPFQA